MASKRKKILADLGVRLSYFEFECSIDEVIQKLQDWKSKFPDKVLILEQESDYDGEWRLTLKEERLENDQEYKKRLDLQQRQAEAARKRELEQLAILTARYGGGNG